MRTKRTSANFANLRSRAEEILKKKLPKNGSQLSEADALQLMHEVEVHQIELELQEEEMMWAEERAIEEARKIYADEYIEMYNLTQSGYFALSTEGEIIELNLSGAHLLGKERAELKNSRFGFFVTDETRPVFNVFLDKVFSSRKKESCEITLLKDNKLPRYVDLVGIISKTGEHCLVTVSDVTGIRPSENTILENKSRLEFAMRAVNMAWWEMDITTGKVTFGNRKAEMLGYPPEKFKHYTDFTALLHPDDYEKAMNAMRRHFSGDLDKYEVEYRILTHSGTYKWFYDLGSIVKRDESGKPLNITGIVIDITERKQTEIALHESVKRYEELTQISPIGIFRTDENGLTTFVNPAWCQISGLSFTDALGDNWLNAVHPDDRENISKGWKDASQVHKTSVSDYRFVRPDGSVAWVLGQATPEINTEGKTIGYIGTITDITKHQEAEDAIRESNFFFQSLLNAIPAPIFYKDLEGRYIGINKAFEQFFGKTSKEIEGKTVFDISPPELAKIYHAKDLELLSQQGVQIYDSQLQNYLGVIRDVVFHKASITDSSGNITGLVGVILDISERKNAEKELIKAKEHAEESDRLKSAFLANMSHEIRTPMNGILGFAGLLKEPNLTGEEQEEYIKVIEKSGARMLNIINDIVCISKVESGLMEITVTETDINEQIKYIYTLFKPETMQKGIQIGYNNALPAEEAIIRTDRDKIYTILTNLIKNALKFTTSGVIEFGYEKKGKYLEFFVKDTGMGILHEQKGFIFERFRQGSESLNRNYEGAGLGLSISKAYVEMLGGKIWVESEFGKGSTFYFTIPCCPEAEEKNADISVETFEEIENQQRKLKILVADDDETSGTLLERFIKMVSNEILTARNGIEAVEACHNNPDIDFILMDIKMPQLDGYEATRQIRKFNNDVIIIAQSAYALSGDREKALEAGCNDYIAKPFGKASIIELIGKYLNK